MNNLIGLAGRAGVGKTTIAQGFKSVYGYNIYSYASPLKLALSELTGVGIQYFTSSILKETPILPNDMTPRELMQKMGTEFVREMIDEDFWVWSMKNRIKNVSKVVIDDIRFENEAQLVRDLGGRVVHLDREYEAITAHANHRSEQQLNTAGDIVIEAKNMTPEDTLKCIVRCL